MATATAMVTIMDMATAMATVMAMATTTATATGKGGDNSEDILST